ALPCNGRRYDGREPTANGDWLARLPDRNQRLTQSAPSSYSHPNETQRRLRAHQFATSARRLPQCQASLRQRRPGRNFNATLRDDKIAAMTIANRQPDPGQIIAMPDTLPAPVANYL